jgi:hypothetical protein
VAARNSTANLGLAGIPLFIAIELMLYGRGDQSHEEKMSHLDKAYAWLRAYLPVLYEKKMEEYEKPRIHQRDTDGNIVTVSISDVVNEAATEITAMYTIYDPSFEGLGSCKPDEKKFLTIMRGVFERLALIVAFSGIADKMSNTEEVFF